MTKKKGGKVSKKDQHRIKKQVEKEAYDEWESDLKSN